MLDKEVREIRRRFRADRGNIQSAFGCFVNDSRKIVSLFEQPLVGVAQEESERYLGLMKKALSGSIGKNLFDVALPGADSDEYRLLNSLLKASLRDEDLLRAFFQRVIDRLEIKGSYLILLARDVYAVPYRAADGLALEDASDAEYCYMICAICPVRQTKAELSYFSAENRFHSSAQGFAASAPVVGFLYPAFDGRAANVSNALFYAKSAGENHAELADALFAAKLPMPAGMQKETFQAALTQALGEECSFEVLQNVHEQLNELIETHESSKDPEPLVLSASGLGAVLKASGVSEACAEAFEKQLDAAFGGDAAIPPMNVIDKKSFEIRTPDVLIKVNAERSDRIELRRIDNRTYILVSADGGVEVNGVDAHIKGMQ